jgi:hypothetical protein
MLLMTPRISAEPEIIGEEEKLRPQHLHYWARSMSRDEVAVNTKPFSNSG